MHCETELHELSQTFSGLPNPKTTKGLYEDGQKMRGCQHTNCQENRVAWATRDQAHLGWFENASI